MKPVRPNAGSPANTDRVKSSALSSLALLGAVPIDDARHCGTVKALDALSLTMCTFLELQFVFTLKADIKS